MRSVALLILKKNSALKAENKNMSQDNLIKLQCVNCKRVNYWSRKNRKKVERKIEFKKYCRWCKGPYPHKESKK